MHHSGVQFGIDAPFSLGECMAVLPELVRDSCFFERISKYIDTFGEASVLVLFLEDLMRDPARELARCFAHLGVDENFRVDADVHLNKGSAKLYDSRLLRFLRNRPSTGPRLAKVHPHTQDKYFRPLGLRRPFHKKSIAWDARAQAMAEDTVIPDARRFLAAFGKPVDFWTLEPPARR